MPLRLERIAISQFRGIRELELHPRGESIAVVGPNGSGKSSIADAIDFVLTGRIGRLTGEGAGQLKLAAHGPHVDASAADGRVELEFRTEVVGSTVSLYRKLDAPGVLDASGDLPAALLELLSLANDSGGHLLTRRDILDFVRVQPSERGRHIAQLLQIEALDGIRKQLAGAAKEAKRNLEDHRTRVGALEQALCECFDPPPESMAEVPPQIRALRTTLGADPRVDTTDPDQWLSGVARPGGRRIAEEGPSTRSLFSRLQLWLGSVGDVAREISELLREAEKLQEDEARLASMKAHDLIERGLGLLAEDRCPLCLTDWSQQDLQDLLEARLQAGTEASQAVDTWSQRRSQAAVVLQSGAEFVKMLTARVPRNDPFARDLDHLFECIVPVVGLLPDDVLEPPADTNRAQEALGALQHAASSLNAAVLQARVSHADLEAEPERAWDALSNARSAYQSLAAERSRGSAIERCAAELAAVSRIFLSTRDQVLSETYDAIAGRLSALYCRVHGPDEASFTANLKPTKAGVNFEVDFYGRGAFPPAALHSEGHQDSMGVLLFLALAEHLAGGHLPLVILDDVLMSVDKGHRRAMAELLKEEYADTQFVITTHDEVWWRQLLSLGVARRKTAVAFKAWDIQDGPVIAQNAAAMLGYAKQALDEGDVPRSAHALRRAIEVHLPEICHALGAQVRFRADGSWQAGDYMNGVQGRYASLLKKGRKAAERWGHEIVEWEERDAQRQAVFKAFGTEGWAVNPMVHWNEWADLGVEDFVPVVAAYDGLFSMLTCPECEGCLYIQEEGATETALRCDCATVNWNLKANQ